MSEKNENLILNEQIKEDVVNLFQAFSNKTRLNILFVLKQQPLTVTEICEKLDVSQSAISHQLRRLKLARLVSNKREGRKIIYTLADHHIHDIFDLAIEHVKEIYHYE